MQSGVVRNAVGGVVFQLQHKVPAVGKALEGLHLVDLVVCEGVVTARAL